MKRHLYLLSLLVAVLALAFTNAMNHYKIDTKASKISWKGYKVTGTHKGHISLKKGKLLFDGGMLTGGSFVVDMSSITCTDLEGEWKQKLEGHLMSPDFFDSKAHPTATFEVTKVVSRGTPGDYKIVGDLSIKGITQQVKFMAHVEEADKTVKATGKMTIDRSDFDVRYGSGSFFDGLKDKTIYDEFDLELELVGK